MAKRATAAERATPGSSSAGTTPSRWAWCSRPTRRRWRLRSLRAPVGVDLGRGDLLDLELLVALEVQLTDTSGVLSILLFGPRLFVRHSSRVPAGRPGYPRAPRAACQHGGVTNRTSPISEIMITALVTVAPDDGVEVAMRALVDHDVDAAPVVDAGGAVVGLLSNSDLIVRESRLHFPTLLSFLGASIEIGHKRFEEDLTNVLSSKVADVMTVDPVTCADTDSIEDVATLMHDHDIGQVPVVSGGRLVGVVSRNDVLRAILNE